MKAKTLLAVIGVLVFVVGRLFRILHWEFMGFVNGANLTTLGLLLLGIAIGLYLVQTKKDR